MFNFNGKIGLITGGAKGIGAAIAKTFLQGNLKGVAIVDINEKTGLQTTEELNKKFGKAKAIFIRADVSNKDQYNDAFKETVSFFKNLDIVVNNAGILLDGQWEKEIGVNLIGTVNGTILAFENYLPKYKSGDEGVIVNMSSLSGLQINPASPVYGATKSGVIGLTRTFGFKKHYERTKVKVLGICPGCSDTAIFDINKDTFIGAPYFKMHDKFLTLITNQPLTVVSEAVVKIIKEGKSGSIWAVEKSEPVFEIIFPFDTLGKNGSKK